MGGWKKLRKKSKFGPKLHEFKRIRDILEFILEISKIIFRKSLIGGGTNKWKWAEKNQKIGNWGPPTIRDGRVYIFFAFEVHHT